MTFEERCRMCEQCIPESDFKKMMVNLHNEMLLAIKSLPEVHYCNACDGSGVDPEIVQEVCCGAPCYAWECGGRGCSGVEPQPTPCRGCNGSGKVT